jgi:Transposase DDE domain group 1
VPEDPHHHAQSRARSTRGKRRLRATTQVSSTRAAAGHGALKDTGLGNLPSADMSINTAWLTTALIAHDLLAWTQLICLDDDLARAEPKRLRYCLLHAAGHIARSGRRTRLRLAATWPWATDLVTAFDKVRLQRLQT